MQIHNLPKTPGKAKKRVGRGGKRGFTSGRGTKGQKARAGRKIRPSERDLIMGLPKKRGFANNPKSDKPEVVNVSDLERMFSEEKKGVVEVTPETLKRKGVISRRFSGKVKVLGDGDISTALQLQGFLVSSSAKEKIESAGGKIIE